MHRNVTLYKNQGDVCSKEISAGKKFKEKWNNLCRLSKHTTAILEWSPSVTDWTPSPPPAWGVYMNQMFLMIGCFFVLYFTALLVKRGVFLGIQHGEDWVRVSTKVEASSTQEGERIVLISSVVFLNKYSKKMNCIRCFPSDSGSWTVSVQNGNSTTQNA